MEEVGIEIFDNEINEPFMKITYLNKDYPKQGINRKSDIYYYIIKTLKEPDITKVNYTENEKQGNFKIEKIPLDVAINTIKDNIPNNELNKVIAPDVIEALNEYFNFSMNNEIQIVEYDNKYLEDVKDLLVELEEYIVSIDKDDLDQVHFEYREKMAIIDLDDVNNNDGKCYIALNNNRAVGLIMGCIFPYDDYDYLDYKCPKRGEITELIVTQKIRAKGVGQALMSKMEEYFLSMRCEYILVDVFGYNNSAIKFYSKYGYHTRMLKMIKKITD